MATIEALMTAEEFGQRPDPGYPEELVQGMVVAMPPPGRRDGKVGARAGRIIGNWVDDRDLGHVMGNDSGVITQRDPDSVRGPDVAYFSYARLPKDASLEGYGPEVPELVFEVRSPSESWPSLSSKASEYLEAGVLVAVVLDPDSQSAHVFAGDAAPRVLKAEDELSFPGILEGFNVRVGRFFE